MYKTKKSRSKLSNTIKCISFDKIYSMYTYLIYKSLYALKWLHLSKFMVNDIKYLFLNVNRYFKYLNFFSTSLLFLNLKSTLNLKFNIKRVLKKNFLLKKEQKRKKRQLDKIYINLKKNIFKNYKNTRLFKKIKKQSIKKKKTF